MGKEVGFNIRVEKNLKNTFIGACKELDLTASQVLRSFMRQFIEEKSPQARQRDLFSITEKDGSNERIN